MADVVWLDRHVLASPATAYDTAWSTYGWTAGVRDRVGRLEEEVPWGTHVARAAHPPRLSGAAGELLRPNNRDRLGSAVLPVDGRLGFSLWGAAGPVAPGGDRRVLTHTLLLDDKAFRQVAGHPEGLLGTAERPSAWFRDLVEGRAFLEPTVLEPVPVSVGPEATAALARARLEELARLRSAVLEGLGGDPHRLASLLASVYEALARAISGPGGGPVVVRGVGAGTSRLLRLVWLSLPLEDRLRVSYVTEQRRSERPRGRLLGLPEAEWGRYVPDGSWVLGEAEPFEAGAGRIHWARTLALSTSLDGFRRMDARAAGRGWRLVGADDLAAEGERDGWRALWRSRGPTGEGVRALWALERGRPGGARAGAVGRALGEVVAAASPGEDAEAALEEAVGLAAELPAEKRVPVIRAAVRGLRGGGPEGLRRAGLLRCRAAASGEPAVSGELHRLVDRESDALRALLADPRGDGGAELLAGALPLAVTGDPVGRELVRLGAAETRWTPERAAELERTLEARAWGAGAGPCLVDILTILVREGHDRASVARVAEVVVPRMDDGALRALAGGLSAVARADGEVDSGERPRPEALRDLAVTVLLRSAHTAGPADDAGYVALLVALAKAHPPTVWSRGWARLVAEAPAAWLGRPATCRTLVDGLEAGRHPFTGPTPAGRGADAAPARRLAADLAHRLLERAGATGLGQERAGAVLRLLWAAGSDDPLAVLDHRPDARVAVLAELLAVPAPVPLFHRIRRRLATALDEGPPVRSTEPWAGALADYAPALSQRLGGPDGAAEGHARRVFLGGRP